MKSYRKRVKYHLDLLKVHLGIKKVKLTEDFGQWKNIAQEFEFNFHKTNQFRQSEEFVLESKILFESFAFIEDQYNNKLVVDLGAGSRMRGKFFRDAKHIIIEPMAERCMKEIYWCDFNDAYKVFSKPAEEMIDELEGNIDFLFSINVLDHCFDFEKIVKNIYRYIKSDGLAFLSFDSHVSTSTGHPLILTEDICNRIFSVNGFIIKKFSKGFAGEFKRAYPKTGYDNSSDCLNYWLAKS